MDFTLFLLFLCSVSYSAALQLINLSSQDGTLFDLGNVSYFAPASYQAIALNGSQNRTEKNTAITVVQTNASIITAAVIEDVLHSYAQQDDVFSMAFTGFLLFKTANASSIPSSSLDYLSSIGSTQILVDQQCSFPPHKDVKVARYSGTIKTPPGPYFARWESTSVKLSKTYRLYEDVQRNFLYGSYPLEDGTGRYAPFDISLSSFGYPLVPVPSRLYSLHDKRPFAGFRISVKDLYDMKGLVTTGGSQAWASISAPANATAPALQRILDLGGVLVGKFKLAQFASGADPWEWVDEHYPFNVRGDGYLTCSASSSGGGCSIAAYEWLDFAIGTDTDQSMRLPAAASGTYGQRPSQGMMSLEGVLPLSGSADTAGVFSRDPYKWTYFAKHWYTSSLYQSSDVTGLSPLNVPDTNDFPKAILYPSDFLPLNNSAAQSIVDAFVGNLSSLFGMQVKHINFTDIIANASSPAVRNLAEENNNGAFGNIATLTQYDAVGGPLISKWASMFDGRFPPIEYERRSLWYGYNTTEYNQKAYKDSLRVKNEFAQWYETEFQYSTSESCSESVMLYEIGTGGYPSYREEDLNTNDNENYGDYTPPWAVIDGAGICPIFGCADFTIPIGQVPYSSAVTYHEEMVPLTINMVVKRGCDFVLYNMIEKLADAGVLKAVKTGRTAF